MTATETVLPRETGGHDDPLHVDKVQFSQMICGVAGTRSYEMPGLSERRQPGGGARAMFADEAEGRRSIELQLRERRGRLADQVA